MVDITPAEIREFVLSLSEEEKRYYNISWTTILLQSIFIKGYWDNGKLIGIAGASRAYFIVYKTFLFVKKTHWGKGIGTQQLTDALSWMRCHRVPYDIFDFSSENIRTKKVHEKMGMRNDVRIGRRHCNVIPFVWWMTPLRYPMLTMIWCYYMLYRRYRKNV